MIDLHLHLDGSLSPEDVLFLADTAGITLPAESADTLRPLLQVEPDCRNLGEYLQKFDLPLQVLQTEKAIEFSVYLLLKRLSAQGLCYAEIRFAPQLHLNRGLTQQQVVAAAVAGLQKGITEFSMPAQLILCCMRGDSNQEENLETVRVAKAFLDKGICAIDLAGNEAAYPTEDFTHIFKLAKELELPFIIHAGEAAGPESISQALSLGARRIGHGVHAIQDTAVLTQLQAQKIPLETCFTSNLQTKAVATEQDYPLCEFLKLGIAITVNTDNMTVSGTDLRNEYRLLQAQFGLSVDTLLSITCNAADAAFLPAGKKEKLKKHIKENFANWLST